MIPFQQPAVLTQVSPLTLFGHIAGICIFGQPWAYQRAIDKYRSIGRGDENKKANPSTKCDMLVPEGLNSAGSFGATNLTRIVHGSAELFWELKS
jgi:hypothetical protein